MLGYIRNSLGTPKRQWKVGDVLETRYEVSKVIPGVVTDSYIVYDSVIKQSFFVKTLSPIQFNSERAQELYSRETYLSAKVKPAPHVATFYFSKSVENVHCLFFEFILGPSIRELMGRLTTYESIQLAVGTASGLLHLHEVIGISHRDVKPENIMIESAHAKLVDFGLSGELVRPKIAVEKKHLVFPEYRTPFASYPYAAPEFWNQRVPGRESDIYSLGVVLSEMLLGELPEAPNDMVGWKNWHTSQSLSIYVSNSKDISKTLKKLIMDCISFDHKKRPHIYDVLMALLREFKNVTGEYYDVFDGTAYGYSIQNSQKTSYWRQEEWSARYGIRSDTLQKW